MKIILERDVLAEAVSWTARSLPNRPSVPILAGLLLKATQNQVSMSSFDYETSANITVDAQVFEEGVVLVSGKLLSEIARTLPNKPVEISTDANSMKLVCGSANFTLQLLPVDEYPALPQMPTASGVVDSQVFAAAVGQVSIAAGKDELLPVFTGVRMEFDDNNLSLLATDRYRMALKEVQWRPTTRDEPTNALVPARVLIETAKSMTTGEQITISLAHPSSAGGDGLIGFEGAGNAGLRQITTRLLDGEFPKVRHVMDIDPALTVRLNTAELIAAVKRVSLVAERNTSLRMNVAEESITLQAATGDQAQAVEELEAVVSDLTNEGLSLTAAGFNPHYLADALSILDSAYVSFSFTQPGKPCLMTALDEIDGDPRPDYRHVIMLMRIPT